MCYTLNRRISHPTPAQILKSFHVCRRSRRPQPPIKLSLVNHVIPGRHHAAKRIIVGRIVEVHRPAGQAHAPRRPWSLLPGGAGRGPVGGGGQADLVAQDLDARGHGGLLAAEGGSEGGLPRPPGLEDEGAQPKVPRLGHVGEVLEEEVDVLDDLPGVVDERAAGALADLPDEVEEALLGEEHAEEPAKALVGEAAADVHGVADVEDDELEEAVLGGGGAALGCLLAGGEEHVSELAGEGVPQLVREGVDGPG